MSDDWRVKVTFADEQHAPHLVQSLAELELESDALKALGKKITVTRDGDHIFLYANSEPAAKEAERVVRELAAQGEMPVEIEVRRWHPVSESWEDANVPLPTDDAALAAERERLMQREREESRESGYAEWEVQVEFDRHHEAVEFSKRLAEEGTDSVRRWRYVFVGASNESEAAELAESFRQELAGTDAQIEVSLSGERLLESMPPNPFAFLGGLSG